MKQSGILFTMRKLITVFILGCFFTSSAWAIQEDKIASVMENKIDKVLSILQNKENQKENKVKEIFSIMDEVFDYKLMSRISLGKTWKKISNDQKASFYQLFEKKLKASYIDKLDLYTDEKIKILDAKQVKKNRIKLLTNVIGKDEIYEINYKFYKAKSGEWFIYDVDIIGVSIIQTYRKQFASFLQTKSFDELLKTL